MSKPSWHARSGTPVTLRTLFAGVLGMAPCSCILASGVQIATGAAPWKLTTVEEPASVILLSEQGIQAVDTVFVRAGQSAALAPSKTYVLEFLVKPAKGARQAFHLAEASGSRTCTLSVLAVKDPLPPRSVLYFFQFHDLGALDFVTTKALTAITLP